MATERQKELESITPILSSSSPRFHGWRFTVFCGFCLSCLVLVINIVLLIWSCSTATAIKDGIATIYQGDCGVMKTTSTYSHLGINVMSSLLLSASNACMQIVSSPTPQEVSRAHDKGNWLHIGVLGVRNFGWISTWRRIIWVLLIFSSIPVHLLCALVPRSEVANR